MLFSPHSIANREEQQETTVEANVEEVGNDEVWSQFKRKLKKESSDTFVFLKTKAKKKSTIDCILDLQLNSIRREKEKALF